MASLSKPGREITSCSADAELSSQIHTDSKPAASTRLRKVAAAWGVTPQKAGEGFEFDLPLRAVRFAAPKAKRELSPEAREAARVRFRGVRESKFRSAAASTDRGTQVSAPEGAR